jgi:asparagine synthase (glutamine-hydrolysing)
MCGICGFVTPDQFAWPDIEAMCQSLSHRGPDDHGSAVFRTHDLVIGLGHSRLSIIDLSEAGHQPMADDSQQTWIVYNGEVYNFSDLRRKLLAQGFAFRGHSDTEVILYAYKHWGIACLERLHGMFALAIYDRSANRLILARDRIGIKPLYYSAGETLLFASELKALMACQKFQRKVDLDSLYQYLSFQYVPAPRSIFVDTYKLEPGCYVNLNLDTNDFKVSRYWDPMGSIEDKDQLEVRAEEGYLECVKELLYNSVQGHMISDVPVGAFLSGGIDSSLVVAMMAQQSSQPVKTFTIGFHEAHHDEAPFARRVAEHLHTDHHEHYLEPQDVFEVIPSLVDYYDEPFGDSSALPTFLLAQFARQEVKVVLSGDGGDELFGGYTRYGRLQKITQVDKLLPAAVRKQIFGVLRWLPVDELQRISAGMQYDELIEVFHYLLAMWKGDDHASLIGYHYDFRETLFYSIWRQTTRYPLLKRLMLIDLKTYLPDDGLTKVDRASMAHSLEVRVPLLDYHIAEFALRLPTAYQARNGEQKYLLKKLLSRYIPPEFYMRPKMGFRVPLNAWLRNELHYLVDEYLNSNRIRSRGLLDADFLNEIVDKHMSGRYDYFYMLWTVIMLEMWFERWID